MDGWQELALGFLNVITLWLGKIWGHRAERKNNGK